jgi:DNA polymerase-3 subunit alpha
VVSGHNVEFDYNIVGAEFYRKNIKDNLQEKPKADTMILGTDFCQLEDEEEDLNSETGRAL